MEFEGEVQLIQHLDEPLTYIYGLKKKILLLLEKEKKKKTICPLSRGDNLI